ncbi:MAG TPA: ECF-type sigma factor [Gemmataceae bacterium]|nr:ECF-type sigma factor [Gemmataceae bacterium]
MGDEADSMAEVVGRAREGDPEAAERLFAAYSERLTRLAEQHLSRKLAGRVDGEEVMLSAFRTFFRRAEKGEFRIDGSAQLWRLLVRLTLCKVAAKAREHTAGCRDVGAEVSAGNNGPLLEAMAEGPDPSAAAELEDEIAALLQDLPEIHGHILRHRLEGRSVAEIAPLLGISRQAVYRVLDLLQERLAERIESGGE